MNIRRCDIECYRGESFTLDFDVRNLDGTPFVLWSGYSGNEETSEESVFKNPYILFAITGDEGDDDMVINYWLDCTERLGEIEEKFPRFDVTEIQVLPAEYIHEDDTGIIPVNHHARTCVYRVSGSDRYVYVKDINFDTGVVIFADYEFRIIVPVSSEDTLKLNKMNYSYSLTLVDGELNSEFEENDVKPLINTVSMGVLLAPHKFTVYSAYRR